MEATRVAVIARVRGAAEEPADLTVALDSEAIGRVTVPVRQTIRVDLAALLRRSESHSLTITSQQTGWALDYLEIANVHGFTAGLISLVVVPRPSQFQWTVAPVAVLLLAIALIVLRPRLDWPDHRVGRWLYRLGVAVVLMVLAAVLLAGVATPYRVLLSAKTFCVCLAILY